MARTGSLPRALALLTCLVVLAGAAASPALAAVANDDREGAEATAAPDDPEPPLAVSVTIKRAAYLETATGELQVAGTETSRRLRVHGPRIVFSRSVTRYGHDPFRSEIFSVTSNGAGLRRLTDNNVEDNHPAFSPDGRHIAFTRTRKGNTSIYVMTARGTRARRMTTSTAIDSMPDWSPNGRWIVFTRHYNKQRQSDLFRVRVADRRTRRITRTPARELRPSWSPDGKLIAYTKLLDAKEHHGIAVIRPKGKGTRWLTRHPRERKGRIDAAPTWSPDSSRVAFARERARGTSDIFTVQRDGRSVRRLTRTDGVAAQPSWGADGRLTLVLGGTIAAVDADGSGLRRLGISTAGAAPPDGFPDWAHTVTR